MSLVTLPSSLLLALLVGPTPQDPPTTPRPRDPFTPSATLARRIGVGADGFVPFEQRPTLPQMKLRGILKMKDKPGYTASVFVEAIGTYVAREGGQIVFSQSGSVVASNADVAAPNGRSPVRLATTIPIVLKVQRVSPEGVVVEVGTLGQTMVIR